MSVNRIREVNCGKNTVTGFAVAVSASLTGC